MRADVAGYGVAQCDGGESDDQDTAEAGADVVYQLPEYRTRPGQNQSLLWLIRQRCKMIRPAPVVKDRKAGTDLRYQLQRAGAHDDHGEHDVTGHGVVPDRVARDEAIEQVRIFQAFDPVLQQHGTEDGQDVEREEPLAEGGHQPPSLADASSAVRAADSKSKRAVITASVIAVSVTRRARATSLVAQCCRRIDLQGTPRRRQRGGDRD